VRVRVEFVGRPREAHLVTEGKLRSPATQVRGLRPKIAVDSSGEVTNPPDEERHDFTLVPSVESTQRGSATATPYSASRESADASPRGFPNSGADFNIRAANQVSLKQSAPGPSNVAGAGITQTKDRQSDIRISKAT